MICTDLLTGKADGHWVNWEFEDPERSVKVEGSALSPQPQRSALIVCGQLGGEIFFNGQMDTRSCVAHFMALFHNIAISNEGPCEE